VQLAKELGIELRVVDRTLDELQQLLDQLPCELSLLCLRTRTHATSTRRRYKFSSLLTRYCAQYGCSAVHLQTFKGEILQALDGTLRDLSIKIVPSRPVNKRLMEEEKNIFRSHLRADEHAEHDIILCETVQQNASRDPGTLHVVATNDRLLSSGFKKHIAFSPMGIIYYMIDPIYRLRTGGETPIERLTDTSLQARKVALTIRQIVFTILSFDHLAANVGAAQLHRKALCQDCVRQFYDDDIIPPCAFDGRSRWHCEGPGTFAGI
jgi:hypothetical protein